MQTIRIQTLEIPEPLSLNRTAFSLVVQFKELYGAVYTLTDFRSIPISDKIGLINRNLKVEKYDLKYSVNIKNGMLKVKDEPESFQKLFSLIKKSPVIKGTKFCRRKRADGLFIEFRGTGMRNNDKYCATLVVVPVTDDGLLVEPLIAYLPWISLSGTS